MSNATLVGDKGYISKEVKIDLFESCNIKLETPNRGNQKGREQWHPVFRKCRKRIETLLLEGLIARLITKIAAVTMLQSMNYTNNKPINHLNMPWLPNAQQVVDSISIIDSYHLFIFEYDSNHFPHSFAGITLLNK